MRQGWGFREFGPRRPRPAQRVRTAGISLPADRLDRRRAIREHCRPIPGIYGMIDAQGELIYVGKSKSLCDRLLSYCTPAAEESKSGRIIQRAVRLVWETAADEFAALLRELELIRRFRPQFNVQGQPERLRRSFVCLGRSPAAYAYLAGSPSARSDFCFGPLPGVTRWRDAVRRLNDVFGLRDCSDRVPIRFADQRELFVEPRAPACIRHELGTCLGPCAARCTSGDYADRLAAAAAFLRGDEDTLLPRLEATMRSAAAAGQYERAATVRDTLADLGRLREQLQCLTDARGHYRFVYPLPASRGGETWYLLRRGQVAAAVRAPRDRRSADRCLDRLDTVYFHPPEDSPPMPEDLDFLLLVPSWFKRHPGELLRTLTPEAAAEACRNRAGSRVHAA